MKTKTGLPVVALVGRPNVGKSTLFNLLTQTKDALVDNMPGVTRDRQYGQATLDDKRFLLIDTGGFVDEDEDQLATAIDAQIKIAMQEADYILYLVDAKAGLLPVEHAIVDELRRLNKPFCLVINKADRLTKEEAAAEFYALGIEHMLVLSAQSKRGLIDLKNLLADQLNWHDHSEAFEHPDQHAIKLAVIGRPNVGKSTLVNRMLGEQRQITSDVAGTTRDIIHIPFEHHGKAYVLIDTAGVRRKARIKDRIEKFSVIKTLQAIDMADVVLVVVDVTEGITDQDMHILGLALQNASAVIVLYNKWDALDESEKILFKENALRRLQSVEFVRRYAISAVHGTGVGLIYHAVTEAYQSLKQNFTTPGLTRALQLAVKQHQPPVVSGRRIKLRYAHLGGRHPLRFVVHGKQVQSLPQSYQRYLANFFRQHFHLSGVPLHLKLLNDDNPYV